VVEILPRGFSSFGSDRSAGTLLAWLVSTPLIGVKVQLWLDLLVLADVGVEVPRLVGVEL